MLSQALIHRGVPSLCVCLVVSLSTPCLIQLEDDSKGSNAAKCIFLNQRIKHTLYKEATLH